MRKTPGHVRHRGFPRTDRMSTVSALWVRPFPLVLPGPPMIHSMTGGSEPTASAAASPRARSQERVSSTNAANHQKALGDTPWEAQPSHAGADEPPASPSSFAPGSLQPCPSHSRGSRPRSIPRRGDGRPRARTHHPCSRVRPVPPRRASPGQPGPLLSLHGGQRAAAHRRTRPPEPLAWLKPREQHQQITALLLARLNTHAEGTAGRPTGTRAASARCFWKKRSASAKLVLI